jgi:23S rRNA (guanosine2251-2'-O)-methyltransferase
VLAVLEGEPGRVRAVYAQRGRKDRRLQEIVDAARAAGVRVEFVERRQLDRRADGPHQGVVADCHELEPADESELEARWDALPRPLLLLALDGVTDPRNLGACLRSANAAGVSAVLLPRRRTAPLSAVALKAAAGGAEGLLLVEVANLARRLAWLAERGVWIVGAAGEGAAEWTEGDLAGDCLLVLGAEDRGLRELTRRHCDQLLRIPMAGSVSSLNVSVAAGILLFEAVRQRRDAAGDPRAAVASGPPAP